MGCLVPLILAGWAALADAGEGSVLEYDQDGRLRQLEYTLAATRRGGTVIGATVGTGAAIVSWGSSGASNSPLASDASEEGDAFVAAEAVDAFAHPSPLFWKLGHRYALAATGLAGDAEVRPPLAFFTTCSRGRGRERLILRQSYDR